MIVNFSPLRAINNHIYNNNNNINNINNNNNNNINNNNNNFRSRNTV